MAINDKQLREQLGNMRLQEQALEAQLEKLQAQLQMTRGAVQMLEHLLTLDDSAAGDVSSDEAVINEQAFRRP